VPSPFLSLHRSIREKERGKGEEKRKKEALPFGFLVTLNFGAWYVIKENSNLWRPFPSKKGKERKKKKRAMTFLAPIDRGAASLFETIRFRRNYPSNRRPSTKGKKKRKEGKRMDRPPAGGIEPIPGLILLSPSP